MKPSDNSKVTKLADFQGTKFLLFVVLLYLILFFVDKNKTIESLYRLVKNTWSVLPVFLLVIFLTAVINYYFGKEKIARMLQTASSFKMYLISLLAGIISHGPVFVWYPLLKELQSKGLKNKALVTFIYARSIKLTLLPIMIGFFGQLYTVVFVFFIALAAVLQGVVFSIIYNPDD